MGAAWDGFVEDRVTALTRRERDFYRGKSVLVTGAGGFLGSGLVRGLAGMGIRRLLLLDVWEYGLYRVQEWLAARGGRVDVRLALGSVADRGLVREMLAGERPEMVFHCAALKHAPMLEDQVFAAAETNVLGTEVVVSEAARQGAGRVVLLSTDKAADPVGVMGATKRVAELIVLGGRAGGRQDCVVRLCNVVGSTGSVAPLFVRQARREAAMTVSDREATRFFMTRRDAVRLLLRRGATEGGAGLVVPRVGEARRIAELAGYLQRWVGAEGLQREVAEVVYCGLRRGEKLHERLTAAGERITGESGSWTEVAGDAMPAELGARVAEIGRAVQERSEGGVLAGIGGLVPGFVRMDGAGRDA